MSVEDMTKESYQKVKESSMPTVIDFWASWCGPCQMMLPVFEETSKEYEGQLNFARVNVDSERELAAAFGVRGIPTLVLINEGKEMGRFSGFMPKEALMQKIDAIVSGSSE